MPDGAKCQTTPRPDVFNAASPSSNGSFAVMPWPAMHYVIVELQLRNAYEGAAGR